MAAVSFYIAGRRPLAAALIIGGALLSIAGAADKKTGEKNSAGEELSINYNIPLWDAGKVPLANGNGPLDAPFLTVFLPPENKRNGASVIIAPGRLQYHADVWRGRPRHRRAIQRLGRCGVCTHLPALAAIWRERPRDGRQARRASGSRARRRIEAGSRTKSAISVFRPAQTRGAPWLPASGPGDPNAADPVDRISSRPDYLALVYGPGRATPGESLKNFPPTFLMAAAADSGPAIGSAQLFMDLTRAGAVAEIHVYQKGRHGFGSGFASGNFSDWMPRLAHFLRQDGFLPAGKQMMRRFIMQLSTRRALLCFAAALPLL